MSTLGEIHFRDAQENEHVSSICESRTLIDLVLFAQHLEAFTISGIVGVSWYAEASISYEDGVKMIQASSPEQWSALDIPPAGTDGLTCKEFIAVYMMRKAPRGRRAFTLPAPRLELLEESHLIRSAGDTLTTLFNALTDETTIFQGGRLITPRR